MSPLFFAEPADEDDLLGGVQIDAPIDQQRLLHVRVIQDS